ncbi:MAG: glycogen debranching protein, partial [Planctomycetota bacterium]
AVSIIAGYPWFADWGRDTMIALPGLLLETGRFDEALSTLELFASHMHRGLIPNRFDDYAGGAHYNTVDASLWFVHAATEYLLRTQDDTGFARLIEPCLEIIEAYQRGTDYNIHLDDGLIAAGSPSTQLTWMDAQRDGVTFTPRYGKCVEINALWHHGLRRLSRALAGHTTHRTVELDTLAARCAERFTRLFNNPAGGLYDRLEPTASGYRPVDEIRPNQIFAASLADAPLDHAGRASVVKTVRRELLTPFGLRTLAPSDPAYIGHYRGNLFERDRAYHNGTVWPWLIGPFVEAALRVDPSQHARTSLRALLQPLTNRMSQVCLGQVGEICDGDEPHTPDGCPAQAWSVAELLRAWIMLASNSTSRPTKDPR